MTSDFNKTNYMSFLIKDIDLLKKCTEIWEKVDNNFKKGFNSDSISNKKCLKANHTFVLRRSRLAKVTDIIKICKFIYLHNL